MFRRTQDGALKPFRPGRRPNVGRVAKKGRHRRSGGGRSVGSGRVTPKGTRPLHADPRPRHDDDEPDLLASVRRGLSSRDPLDLLAFVSGLIEVASERHGSARRGSMGFAELVETFTEVDRTETTALLACCGALLDGELGARARTAAAARRQHLPRWVATLDDVTVGDVWVMRHVLDDGDNYFIEARWPGGEVVTGIVYVDTNMGWVVKDAFAIPEALDRVLVTYRQLLAEDAEGADTTFSLFDAADARARIEEALAAGAMLVPPFQTDTWPVARPLIEWMVRLLPQGGTGFELAELAVDGADALADRFLASPAARSLVVDDAARAAVAFILAFAVGTTGGDVLRWSEVRVEVLLADWLPRKVIAPVSELARVPEVLRAFVQFAHAERGIPGRLTAEVLAAIEMWTPEFFEAIGGPRFDEDWSEAGTRRWHLAREVGGTDALDRLDTTPIADEPFDWTGIDDDIRLAVQEILDLVDGGCDALFDVEIRTICRRVLARAAARSPKVFRRRARADYGAAAIVWLVGHGNRAFSGLFPGSVADVQRYFAIASASLADRANTIRKAAGICPDDYHQLSYSVRLADPTLLHSQRRARLVADRDRP